MLWMYTFLNQHKLYRATDTTGTCMVEVRLLCGCACWGRSQGPGVMGVQVLYRPTGMLVLIVHEIFIILFINFYFKPFKFIFWYMLYTSFTAFQTSLVLCKTVNLFISSKKNKNKNQNKQKNNKTNKLFWTGSCVMFYKLVFLNKAL